MATTKTKKASKSYIVRPAPEDAPGGTCESKECPIKRVIGSGMTIVHYDGKTYHASCAIREGISFKVPVVPKSQKVD